MPKSSNRDKYLKLSAEFPFLIYEGYAFTLGPEGLKAEFHFNLSDRYSFRPTLFIPRRHWTFSDEVISPLLPSLLFHIGMIELVSYWKTACPKSVIIRPAGLSASQCAWWKKLYYLGLGEFFYLNSIPADEQDFMTIISEGKELDLISLPDMGASVLIPVGGGKDSAVTLELLRDRFDAMPLVMNPRGATSAVIRKAEDASRQSLAEDAARPSIDASRLSLVIGHGSESVRVIEVYRTIDPLLLELNAKGFLNGHTPFSALLAFVTLLAAALTGRKNIVLSNESSANEATIPGTKINHQYSKSLEFEDDFRFYVKNHISPDFNYFSFLRPLNELQIAWLFSRMPAYHDVFRSCNAGSKTDSWCGKCPKCLFTYIILSPFLRQDELCRIFGRNLFGDPELLEFMKQFTGAAEEKPFDCIGTIDEVNLALCSVIKQTGEGEFPVLLKDYKASVEYSRYKDRSMEEALGSYMTNNLGEEFSSILKKALHV